MTKESERGRVKSEELSKRDRLNERTEREKRARKNNNNKSQAKWRSAVETEAEAEAAEAEAEDKGRWQTKQQSATVLTFQETVTPAGRNK